MHRRRFVYLTTATALPAIVRGAESGSDLASPLDEICRRRKVPAVAGGIVTRSGPEMIAVAGVRKAGGKIPVTCADLWHLGSLTKAMTATLLATFVMEGRLSWDAKPGDLLPDLMIRATPDARRITMRQLLTHRSGLPADREKWNALPAAGNRPEIVRIECARPLLSPPGSTYLYSNLGYMIAGVVASRLGGRLWERVIAERVFEPLGMKAGFGGTGSQGKEDQPWPHSESGKPMPSNGPAMDNPASLGPAGTCHAALGEYAKFIADHLRGAAGRKALLKPALYQDLHTPPEGTDYAFGWRSVARAWAGGTALTHNGTNNMNYAVVWMAPQKGFAVIAACNQGGDRAAAACDDVCSLLIDRQR